MNLRDLVNSLWRDENGAAPVDVLSLTASAIGLFLAAFTIVTMVNDDTHRRSGNATSPEHVRTVF